MHKAAHNGCCRRAALTRALNSVLKKLLVPQNLNGLVETIEGPLVNFLTLPKVRLLLIECCKILFPSIWIGKHSC
jgi:hypothetical protein